MYYHDTVGLKERKYDVFVQQTGMVYEWECHQCSYTVWSGNKTSLDADIKSHLFDHNIDHIAKNDFRYRWDCPHCARNTTTHDKETVVEEFKNHLYEHTSQRITDGTHVAETIDRRGSILVEAPVRSESADYARRHFFSHADVAVLVTRDPEARIELFDEKLDDWPARTVLLTTKRRPINSTLDIDFSDISLEIVELDQRLGPDQLGETVSRVIEQHNAPTRQLSFGFDIVYEIIQSFDLQTSYEFVNRISDRLRNADAISHFYIEPHPQLESILNVLEDQFDLKLAADGELLYTKG